MSATAVPRRAGCHSRYHVQGLPAFLLTVSLSFKDVLKDDSDTHRFLPAPGDSARSPALESSLPARRPEASDFARRSHRQQGFLRATARPPASPAAHRRGSDLARTPVPLFAGRGKDPRRRSFSSPSRLCVRRGCPLTIGGWREGASRLLLHPRAILRRLWACSETDGGEPTHLHHGGPPTCPSTRPRPRAAAKRSTR